MTNCFQIFFFFPPPPPPPFFYFILSLISSFYSSKTYNHSFTHAFLSFLSSLRLFLKTLIIPSFHPNSPPHVLFLCRCLPDSHGVWYRPVPLTRPLIAACWLNVRSAGRYGMVSERATSYKQHVRMATWGMGTLAVLIRGNNSRRASAHLPRDLQNHCSPQEPRFKKKNI